MSETLRDMQFALSRHLRDPDVHAPPPGIEARRLTLYRELFFGAIEGLLANSFPVIRQTLGSTQWRTLVERFYASHRSRTPLFPELAGEFVAFVEARDLESGIPPWLPDLAHYEWVEQALSISDATPPLHDRDGDLLAGVPVLSPHALPLAYRWPVAEIGPSNIPLTPPLEPTTLLVHRDAAFQVRFTRIAPLAYHLLEGLRSHDAKTGREHLTDLADAIGADRTQVLTHGLELLRQMHAQGVVLGTRRDAKFSQAA